MKRGVGKRSGFTLVEVMLTTVLAAVLLVALWSLLSMYSKSFEGGHARTEQSQLARALLEQISTDVQSAMIAAPQEQPDVLAGPPGATPSPVGAPTVALPASVTGAAAPSLPIAPPSPSLGSGGTALPAPASGLTPPTMPQNVATASLRPAGIYGTSSFLQLDVLQPAMLPPVDEEDLVLVDPEAAPRADELRTIVYTFEEFRNPADPAAVPETRLMRRELNWAQAHPAHGGRLDGVEAAPLEGALTGDLPRPDEGVAESSFSAPLGSSEFALVSPLGEDEAPPFAETSVPEVLAFGLRYFDGALWSEEWDSASRGGLPLAIEVSLRLRSASEPVDLALNAAQAQSGADVDKIEELKHPTRRLLIPLELARRPARTNAIPGTAPPIGLGEPFAAETPGGRDLP
jgi:prepilin-type N-terminal cleavage/methylation domain-containing protein